MCAREKCQTDRLRDTRQGRDVYGTSGIPEVGLLEEGIMFPGDMSVRTKTVIVSSTELGLYHPSTDGTR